MTNEALRESADMLSLLLVALNRETERHNSECACRYCTIAVAVMLAHNHMLALLEEDR